LLQLELRLLTNCFYSQTKAVSYQPSAISLLSRPTGLSKIRAPHQDPHNVSLRGHRTIFRKPEGCRLEILSLTTLGCARFKLDFWARGTYIPIRYRKKIWAAWKRPTSYRGGEIPQTAIS
jgi:hypothetical protein